MMEIPQLTAIKIDIVGKHPDLKIIHSDSDSIFIAMRDDSQTNTPKTTAELYAKIAQEMTKEEFDKTADVTYYYDH